MLDQPQTPELLAGVVTVVSESSISWIGLMSLRRVNQNTLNFQEQEQGVELRYGQKDPRDCQYETPQDDRRMGHYREPKTADHNNDCKNVHESYSDITRKVKVNVPSFDGKIDATTFSFLSG